EKLVVVESAHGCVDAGGQPCVEIGEVACIYRCGKLLGAIGGDSVQVKGAHKRFGCLVMMENFTAKRCDKISRSARSSIPDPVVGAHFYCCERIYFKLGASVPVRNIPGMGANAY